MLKEAKIYKKYIFPDKLIFSLKKNYLITSLRFIKTSKKLVLRLIYGIKCRKFT